MDKLSPTITSMYAVNKGLYLESFFSIKFDLDDPIKDMLQSVHDKISQCSSQDVSIGFFELFKFHEWEFENYRDTND